MWKRSLCLMPVGVWLPLVWTVPKCAPATSCAILSPQLNASTLCLTSRTEFAQEEPKGTKVGHGPGTDNHDSMKLLMRLATEQILADDKFLGRSRFNIDKQGRNFSYSLSSVPAHMVLSDGDPYATPLEALIRAESLRRDFRAAVPNETFWSVPLDSVEIVIQRCVQMLDTSQHKEDAVANQEECSKNINEQFVKLEATIVIYATAQGFERVQPSQTRDPAIGYWVHIQIDPPKARVRVMPLLAYKKYQYSNTPKEQYQWSDLLDSDNNMIGWYHYRVEWPAELNGPEEGDFEIRKPSSMTFRPRQK